MSIYDLEHHILISPRFIVIVADPPINPEQWVLFTGAIRNYELSLLA